MLYVIFTFFIIMINLNKDKGDDSKSIKNRLRLI